MLITSPCVVSLSWTLKDAEGDLIDELAEPMEFMVGGDDLFARIEEALQGLGAGQEVDLHLEPEHAFGDYHAELVCFEKRELFPEQLEPGMQFEGPPSGATTPDMPADAIYTVTEIYDEHVVLDANHPLAGMALNLHVKIHHVRPASEEELEQRSAADSGFSVLGVAPSSPHLH